MGANSMVAALVVAIVAVGVVVVIRRRRVATKAWPEVLFPGKEPLALGGRATVRYRAPGSPTGHAGGRVLRATLRCVETVPSAEATVSRELRCVERVVAQGMWFTVEIDLHVPLDAMATMTMAGHRVDWMLRLEDSDQPGGLAERDIPVVVAPVVAAAVLQGEVTP